jgi:3-hydroxyisobutyrate dehydrogenase-like beta-hydroxyacid dehydrogenase
MGMPLARRAVAAGWAVHALARRPEVADELRAAGVVPVGALAEVAGGADVVVVCVRTDAQVLDVALGGDGLLASMAPGTVLVVHTTGSPATAERLAGAGRSVGVAVVDAPFSGSPAQVEAGQIPLLVGGATTAVDVARRLLSAYGEPIFHLGPLGAGQRVKLLNNLLLAANAELALEVLRLGRGIGMAPGPLVDVLQHCSGRSAALGMLGASGATPEAIAHLGGFLVKDIDVAIAVAGELDLDLGVLGRTAQDARASFTAAAAALATPGTVSEAGPGAGGPGEPPSP